MRHSACGCEIDDTVPHGGWADATPAPAAAAVSGTCLCDLAVGDRARVSEVTVPEQPALERRLADLGFTPGTEVSVLRRAPLGDPVVYGVCDYELCLRRAQASRIHVEFTATALSTDAA
ncbi:MAG: ferrous iron transport protein A [Microbacteriaceae bacterium]|jgi:ferrous iron transport protein A|nr:ferrous iron transport protein A [Microbacteriaceae bacterium]MCI1207299.1 ferrous iron transport protein A [Microbacteriaceae bacterium]